ncbi:hypothetical protein SEA_FINKLE_80 [Gordonia phage Finkle]|uniref:Uncharacterized protein n=1 Tax=Gordonia phage Finkle TaxID=2926099 RepID=A0A9E7SZH9_9CAUD|nr:hypothetical protein QEH33_gp80 [Gordonia phage Finkle]UTN92993.1 hypothetical protein SEA_FINKLE_80 [Gordonia phage Finkle]
MRSPTDWLTDQIVAAVQPIADTISRDIVRRIRITITVTFDMEDQ